MEAAARIVALGGGHGLAASLQALTHVTRHLTAVVTVADDGGSSGRLREELGCLPPGDLRMALAALTDDDHHVWRDVLQYRFHTTGPLDQHSVGNLLIVALWQLLGDPVGGLDEVARLLHARGRVLPAATVPLEIAARVRGAEGTRTIHGQSKVAVARGAVEEIWLDPQEPPACPQAVDAVMSADFVVLGPGSWYTSVLPHLLIPGLRDALLSTTARIVLTMNLVPQAGETEGMSAADHLAALHRIAPELRVDTVIGDPQAIENIDDVVARSAQLGAQLLLRQVRARVRGLHDPLRLAAAYRDAFEGAYGDLGRGE